MTTCPCGQTDLEKLYERDGAQKRENCVDPVPTCGKTCGRQLECGPNEAKVSFVVAIVVPKSASFLMLRYLAFQHTCAALCHREPDCPTCPLTTQVRCRCGFMDKEVDCKELTTRADDARCDKR